MLGMVSLIDHDDHYQDEEDDKDDDVEDNAYTELSWVSMVPTLQFQTEGSLLPASEGKGYKLFWEERYYLWYLHVATDAEDDAWWRLKVISKVEIYF